MCGDLNCKIDRGYRHCGCGLPAPLAKKTAMKYGHVKGEPIRYINGHYQRSTPLSPVDYIVDDETGCWVWQRAKTNGGYGELRDGKHMRRAHRVYYERYRGPIPAGLHLDHLCRNPICVNPAHLEPVTSRENALRGNTIAPRKLIEGFPPIDYWVDPVSGCRVWQRYLGVEGYALKRRDGKKIPAHRYHYEMYRGPVPAGLMMGHLCRNRACVNRIHLEPVTAKENAARRDRAKRKPALRVLR